MVVSLATVVTFSDLATLDSADFLKGAIFLAGIVADVVVDPEDSDDEVDAEPVVPSVARLEDVDEVVAAGGGMAVTGFDGSAVGPDAVPVTDSFDGDEAKLSGERPGIAVGDTPMMLLKSGSSFCLVMPAVVGV
jgi:hypothetical protein